MPSQFYIGIAGPATSGKDTVATFILNYLKERVIEAGKVSLADELKRQCSAMLGISIDKFYDPEYKEELRPLMQWYGTEYRRNPKFGGYDFYWGDQVGIAAFQRFEDAQVIVVPDIRYESDADWIREMQGGVVIKVNPVNWESKLEYEINRHSSEFPLTSSHYDYELTNDHKAGTLHLERLVNTLMEKIEERI